MLKGKDIICFSSIDWDFVWQGHQEIMSRLAREGNRVLFIENTGVRVPGLKDAVRLRKRIKNWSKGIKGIREEEENLYIFSPLALPFPYLRFAQWINVQFIFSILAGWFTAMRFKDPLVWTFLPTPLTLRIIQRIDPNLLIYYCIDNFRVSSLGAARIGISEKNLLKKADLVFATSQKLFEYCASFNPRVYLFPFGVNFRQFTEALTREEMIPELISIPKPIIGYVGGVHKWIDFELIAKLADVYGDYSFVFVGPVQTDVARLAKKKNIFFLGNKEHQFLPLFIKHFALCIVPYIRSEYTDNVYPTKLNEYHAMGKPVVSTYLPEIERFNKENGDIVFIARDHEEFIKFLPQALNEQGPMVREKRKRSALKNSWEHRIESMSELIDARLNFKLSQQFNWQENFRRFYNLTLHKISKFALISIVLYFLTFYTPFIWFLAKPLKITQQPQKADTILVFAGGVGESGRAGQGYEERVKLAVDLYNKGYAPFIIFSSGYMHTFKEPLIMRALAVSLGIPSQSIILEDKAVNTNQNVEFVKAILSKRDWKKIILVSSLYHMRRVSLVFNKKAPEIKTIYVPVIDGLFYQHGISQSGKRTLKQISLRQIKSIIHEYLAIVYYWWKGYL